MILRNPGRGLFSLPGSFFLFALWWGFFPLSCAVIHTRIAETPLPPPAPPEVPAPARPSGGAGVAEEIRSLVETGTPSSLSRALALIRERNLGGSEFGRIMTAVTGVLFRKVYPDIGISLLAPDPPQTHGYTRLLRNGERGTYTAPPANSADYLEGVLPFLALFSETREEPLLKALPDLLKAEAINPLSVLAPLFIGRVYERTGRTDEAAAAYERAYGLSQDCYPAALGLARINSAGGKGEEAVRLLSELAGRYPDNMTVKRQLALTYYQNRDWSRAEPAIAEILRQDSQNSEFILMRARVLVEQGLFFQAQAPLDAYGALYPQDRLYLFLRARVQAEGYRNRDAALNYLRALLGSDLPADDEAAVYAIRLFMESSRPEDQDEGRELLRRLLEAGNPPLPVITMALQDAIRREAWREARPYLTRLLNERRSLQDLLNAYKVERGLENKTAALAFARELYERDPSYEEGAISYIAILIDTGRQEEAARLIEGRLANVPGGTIKSRYHYQRSRLRGNEEAAMNDLQSSLFENPRNLSALIAMFEIYHRRRDERRAVYYLKQALALAPGNAALKAYEQEYAALLGNTS